jgi:hypothetical protein
MQLTLPFSMALHVPTNEQCPFCPGKKEGPWTTHPGSTNDSKILRTIMNRPAALTEQQSGARPKDGQDGRQSEDERRPTYTTKRDGVIYNHTIHGDYGDQAHHAISGKQILEDEPIEKLIDKKHGKIEEDTGYSVNNAANGICLPSYPKSYAKRGAALQWAAEDADLKFQIATLPMHAGKGQVHIGEHDIPGDPNDEKVAEIHHTSYPKTARDFLEELYLATVHRWAPECPWCTTGPSVKDPLPAPYRLNQRLDGVSKKLISHIAGAPSSWHYFISDYAMKCHQAICTHPMKRRR